MARIRTDKRSRDVDPSEVAKQVFRERFARARSDEVDLALALLQIDEKKGHVFEGMKSVHAWALPEGCGPSQGRRLLALGRAIRLAPELAEKVRSGEVCSESAVQLGRLLGEAALDLDGAAKQEWLDKAASMPPDAFREAVGKAIDDARQQAVTRPITLFVTRDTYNGFQRVRAILSKGRSKLVTEGEAFGHLVADWRRRHDPRVAPLPKKGRRRSQRRTRHRTAREEARVARRSGHICEICGVARARVFMHLHPWAKGGGQTAEELVHGCGDCHFFLDRGVWVFLGWTPEGRTRIAFNPDRLRPVEETDEPHDAAASEGAPERGPEGPHGDGGADDAPRDGASEVRERAPPYVVAPRPVRSFAARRHGAPPRGCRA